MKTNYCKMSPKITYNKTKVPKQVTESHTFVVVLCVCVCVCVCVSRSFSMGLHSA